MAIEKANSPAIVEATLPPKMLKDRSKRNSSDAPAKSGGIGNGRSQSFPSAHAVTGMATSPEMTTSLNATP